LLAQSETINKRGLYFFLALLLVAAAAFSGYRTGIVAFFFASLIWLLLMRTLSIQTAHTLLLLFILIASGLVLASIISPGNFERFADLRGLITGEKIDDGSFNARLEAYKNAVGLFTGSPLTGAGLGSFKSTPLGSQIKYPHNILLEFAAELGTIGILFFLIFIYSATNRLIKSKSPWLLLFAYSFILSLFSKDIASNSFLFIFLSLTLIKNDSIVYK
jgi:O-antigen ligase